MPDWIIDHAETLVVFQDLGIDDSCGGKSLEFACREKEISKKNMLSKLQEVINGGIQAASPSPH
ncbi:hypothetical protein [Planctomicrobium sp. SH527]|uniref:hypothetical protein n=1 Tax=Planctomicrobium sp. SH527 TaxID=3448123 RepID=UPI003F5AFE3F